MQKLKIVKQSKCFTVKMYQSLCNFRENMTSFRRETLDKAIVQDGSNESF